MSIRMRPPRRGSASTLRHRAGRGHIQSSSASGSIHSRRSGLSESTVGRIWRKSGLKPHLIDGFKLSTDPLFVEKAVDVAGLCHTALALTV